MPVHYSTGKPCRNGHPSKRYVSNGQCVECSKARSYRWASANPEAVRAIKKRTRTKNAESIREYAKLYHKSYYTDDRRAAKAKYDREYRQRNSVKIDAKCLAWRLENPQRAKAARNNYKHRRRTQESDGISSADLAKWTAAQKKVCYWCSEKCPNDYTVDHYEPLSRGGKHEAGNLVIACRTCNVRKNARDPYEFAQSVGRLL